MKINMTRASQTYNHETSNVEKAMGIILTL